MWNCIDTLDHMERKVPKYQNHIDTLVGSAFMRPRVFFNIMFHSFYMYLLPRRPLHCLFSNIGVFHLYLHFFCLSNIRRFLCRKIANIEKKIEGKTIIISGWQWNHQTGCHQKRIEGKNWDFGLMEIFINPERLFKMDKATWIWWEFENIVIYIERRGLMWKDVNPLNWRWLVCYSQLHTTSIDELNLSQPKTCLCIFLPLHKIISVMSFLLFFLFLCLKQCLCM